MRLVFMLLLLATTAHAEVSVKYYGACRASNTPEQNLKALNIATRAAKLSDSKVISLDGIKDCEISDTWVIPSGYTIRGGAARLGDRLIQKTTNAPVIANSAWYNNTWPLGSTRVENIWLSGSHDAGEDNHCLVLTDYMSTVDGVYLSNCGGYGLYLASETRHGFTKNPTLVENTFTNSKISNARQGFRNGSKSDYVPPKLTDGYMSNIRIDLGGSDGEVFELYEAGGWVVNAIHTYAHRTSLKFDRAGSLNVSNLYIENIGDDGAVFKITKAERALNFTNIEISKPLEDALAFDITPVNWVEESTINILGLQVIRPTGEVVKHYPPKTTVKIVPEVN